MLPAPSAQRASVSYLPTDMLESSMRSVCERAANPAGRRLTCIQRRQCALMTNSSLAQCRGKRAVSHQRALPGRAAYLPACQSPAHSVPGRAGCQSPARTVPGRAAFLPPSSLQRAPCLGDLPVSRHVSQRATFVVELGACRPANHRAQHAWACCVYARLTHEPCLAELPAYLPDFIMQRTFRPVSWLRRLICVDFEVLKLVK